MITVKQIKNWLKDIGKDRFWLAQKTFSSKKTVDGWLSAGKVITESKLALIEILISESKKEAVSFFAENNAKEEAREELKPVVVVFTREEMILIEDASAMIGMTPAQFIESVACQDALMSNQTGHGVMTHRSVVADAIEQGKVKPRRRQTPVVKTIPFEQEEKKPLPLYEVEVIGNIAAGGLADGDTEPYSVKTSEPLGKDEYVLRVSGKSMEPQIMDGSLVVMIKHTIPPIPKVETIVEYQDERGVTLKKLSARKNDEGKKEYILKSINPEYADVLPMDGGRVSAVYVRTLGENA